METNEIKISDFSRFIGLKEGTIKSYVYGEKPISNDFLSIFMKTKIIGKSEKDYIEKILENNEKKKAKNEFEKNNKSQIDSKDSMLIKEIIDLKKKIEMLEAKNNLLESLKNIELMDYKDNRKVNAFTSDLQTRTLVSRQLLDLNSEVSKRWGDLKLLLEINNPADNIKIQKGLNTIGDNLLKIGREIKDKSYSEKIIDEEIIDL